MKKITIPKGIQVVLFVCLGVGLLYLAERWYGQRLCESVMIEINPSKGNLMDTQTVRRLLSDDGKVKIENQSFKNLDIGAMEFRVENNAWVKNCQVARGVLGQLRVSVETHTPIARVRRDGKPDTYLNAEGGFMPLSRVFTPRVAMLSGAYVNQAKNLRAAKDSALINLLNEVSGDSLWRSQVAEVEVEGNGEVVLYPQVGVAKIDFGIPQGRPEKFKKLQLFYRHILPFRSPERFSIVSVKFRNQVVCTRKDTLVSL